MNQSPRCFVAALALSCLACGGNQGPRSGSSDVDRSDRPDIVIVTVDTLRADFTALDWEVEGHLDRDHTPFLNSLKKQSVVFESAHSPAPWTLPSVASIVSGLHLVEHGVHSESRSLGRSIPTLAQRLAGAGYKGIAIYRNPYAGPTCGLDRGYEYSELVNSQSGREKVAAVLDEELTEDPLFLYVHNTAPHDPQNVPVNRGDQAPEAVREFSDWYGREIGAYRVVTRLGYQNKRKNKGTDFDARQQKHIDALTERQAEAYEIYANSVEVSDRRIRGIVNELKERKLWQNTVFIVIADHGEEMGEHGGWLHDQSLYNELTHVPFMIRFPKGKFGGTRVRQPASLVDLMPTLMGLVDLPNGPVELAGRDWYTDLADDGVLEESTDARVVSSRINVRKYFGPWAESRGERNLALRQGSWKAIWNGDLDTVELYDLEADPRELNDVAAANPERAEEFRKMAASRWEAMHSRDRSESSKGLKGLNEKERSGLEGLGYLGGEDEDE